MLLNSTVKVLILIIIASVYWAFIISQTLCWKHLDILDVMLT